MCLPCPLTGEDLVVGKKYIWLQYLNGIIMVSQYLLCTPPDERGYSKIVHYYDSGKTMMEVTHEEIGCPSTPVSVENFNRTFTDDAGTYDTLWAMAMRQDLKQWLVFLGIENPDQVVTFLNTKVEVADFAKVRRSA